MLKLARTQIYVMWLAIFLTLASPSLSQAQSCEEVFTRASKIGQSNLLDKVISKGAIWIIESSDGSLVRKASLYRDWDRGRAREIIGSPRARQDVDDPLKFGELQLRHVEFSFQNMSATAVNSTRGSTVKRMNRLDLQRHFEDAAIKGAMPTKMAQLAIEFIRAVSNQQQIDAWVRDLRAQRRAAMVGDGFRSRAQLMNRYLTEYYLDRVMAERARKEGFSVDQLPADAVSFKSQTFFEMLGRGEVFIDWNGADLQGGEHRHSMRGHLLAMVYAAEHIPEFHQLIRYIGRTKDKDGVWELMFDNFHAADSPFWGGRWIEIYRRYLDINS